MDIDRYRVKPGSRVKLADVDTRDADGVPDDKDELARRNEEIQERLGELQELLYAEHQRKLLIVLQGMDTSGKDGTVRHVMAGFNPSGVRVVPFRKPTEPELEHDFLWRVHAQVPGKGEVVVFNRSHYEDVLVVRVHELVPAEVWRARYDQINDFERMLTESGTIVLKFFLHISMEEQRERLQERIDDPRKRWKFQHGDLAERKLWKDYQKAYEDALQKTSTEYAPWYIVPADRKKVRNFIAGTVIEKTLDGLGMKYPEPDLSDIVIE
jgi:PPK2 family polyphosphate:nucleotide phosphotransferase